MERLSLPALTHRLRDLAESADELPPSYSLVAARVRDGLIPAERDGGRWWIRPEDLPAAAAVFGLPAPESPGPQRNRAA